MSIISLLLVVALPGTMQEAAYQKFMKAFGAGADCPQLFALRKEARPRSSVAEHADMTRQLRSVGCFSSSSKRRSDDNVSSVAGSYTVREYRIYRDVVDAPLYMTETQALQMTARKFKTTPARAKASAEKVMRILSQSKWFGSRAAEERRASDWSKK